MAKTLAELIDEVDPGIELVRAWLSQAVRPASLLPIANEKGAETLLHLQVTTRSPIGAMAHSTGGLLIDYGWLRILGSKSERLPRGLSDWNRTEAGPRQPGALLVGDDAIGGFFALNGDGLPGKTGNIFYLAPDSLEWEDLEFGYSQWLMWALQGELDLFYETERWPGWRQEVASLGADKSLLVDPPLWAEGPSLEDRTRKPVPTDELWRIQSQDRARFKRD